jgi:hypothetical protein
VKFRSTYDGQGMIQFFRMDLILPYVDVLSTFRPASAFPGWMPKPQAGEQPTLEECS